VSKLDVVGAANDSALHITQGDLTLNGGNTVPWTRGSKIRFFSRNDTNHAIYYAGSTNSLHFDSYAQMYFNQGFYTPGNVGIGNMAPSQRLVVEGNCIVNGKFSGGIKGTYGPVSSPGSVNYNSYTVSFGTTFSTAPYVMVTARTAGGSPGLLVVNLQSIGTSSFVIRVSDNDYGRAGVSGVVDWVAIGI